MITTFDALVAPDSTARIIKYFVDHVDLDEMRFLNANPAAEGRLSYSLYDMAKLYLYGYRNHIRSSRKLTRACKVNIEVKWLMEIVDANEEVMDGGFTRKTGEKDQ